MEVPVTQEWLIHATGLHKLPVHMGIIIGTLHKIVCCHQSVQTAMKLWHSRKKY
jgi:hypothetical protein